MTRAEFGRRFKGATGKKLAGIWASLWRPNQMCIDLEECSRLVHIPRTTTDEPYSVAHLKAAIAAAKGEKHGI